VFDHVTIRVSDRGASKRFYETVPAALGIGRGRIDADATHWGGFAIAAAGDPEAVRARPGREHDRDRQPQHQPVLGSVGYAFWQVSSWM